ncbi:MAG: hypothetical protein ACOCXA_04285 [Planctomycetota bacterium]
MGPWSVVLLGGGILLPLLWALQVWTRRRRQLRLLDEQACPICRTSYEDAIIEYRGTVDSRIRSQMDQFQRRFASFVIRCEECGSDLVYTDQGDFIKRLSEED